ncbi:MAG: TRAP transporter substrate-binding protein DctP [Desulfamplus sp.]|nr:TRAP transporter substrate-binding protein DctP [Desulfamplus sp.]
MFRNWAFFFSFLIWIVLISPIERLHAVTVLKMNHQFPQDTIGSKIDQWFCDQIKSATGGEIEIRIFWSNGLADPKENLELLKTGKIDMAAMSSGYFSSEMPFFSAPNSIPMGMDNICQSSEIMKKLVNTVPAFREEASKNRVHSLFFHILSPYFLVTKEPVLKFSDLEGKRIRTWGNDMPRLIEAAKAKPIPLFLPDIYDAMKMGVIDGCPFSVDLVVSYKIYELAAHITEVVLWEGPGWGVWVSQKRWSDFSEEIQTIFMKTAELARHKELETTLIATKEAKNFLLQNKVQFHPFPEEELLLWRDANPDFFSDFITQMAQQGKEDEAKQMVGIWQKMKKEVNCP